METINSIRKLLPSVPSTLKDALVETNQPLLDPRLPSVKAAQWLIERYRLDNDYLPEIVSMLLGRPPGGGQADEIIWPRGDDTGLAVFIPKVPYNSTQSQWLISTVKQSIQAYYQVEAGWTRTSPTMKQ